MSVPTEIADFSRWDPEAYLRDYYQTVQPDEVAALAFSASFLRDEVGSVDSAHLFGVGPTLKDTILTAGYAERISESDYLERNLARHRDWMSRVAGSHNWNPFTRHILQLEGLPNPNQQEIEAREDLTRQRIYELRRGDFTQPYPLGEAVRYPLLIVPFCVDSATSSPEAFQSGIVNVASLAERHIIVSALERCSSYQVGSDFFPSANIGVDDMHKALLFAGFCSRTITIRSAQSPENLPHGYQGIMVAHARRSA